MCASQRLAQQVQTCAVAGGDAVVALAAEAQQSVNAAFSHAKQMIATSGLIYTLMAEFVAAGRHESAAALLQVGQAVAAMAGESSAAALRAAQSEPGSGRLAVELAARVAEAAWMMADSATAGDQWSMLQGNCNTTELVPYSEIAGRTGARTSVKATPKSSSLMKY